MTPPPGAAATAPARRTAKRPAARANAARTALQPARRKSGPARAPFAPGRTAPRPAPASRGARPRALAQAGAAVLLDRLLRGRAWVVCVGVLLVGIVFLNVSLLELNKGITRNNDRTAELKRDNAELRLKVARLGSSERIQRMAREKGLVLPLPGRVRYKRPGPGDARAAQRTMTEPRERPVAAVPRPPAAGGGAATGQAGTGRPPDQAPAAQSPGTQGAAQTTPPRGGGTGGAGAGGPGTGAPATGGAGRTGGGTGTGGTEAPG